MNGGRDDPVMGFNFVVTLTDSSSLLTIALSGMKQAAQAGFSECTGLDSLIQVEEYREGGDNGITRKFPTRASSGNLKLRRGIVKDDALWLWHLSYLQGRGKRRDGTVILHDTQQRPVRVWHFVRGMPVKWTGPALNAMQGHVAIEELEIAHEGLVPSSPAAALGNAIASLF
jgi:phage tail-like protein